MPKDKNIRTARQKDADELHMTSNLSAPSVNLLTLIEGNTSSIDDTLDITQSAFRDAILGAATKDFSTIQTVLDSIKDTDGIKKITDAVTVIQPNADLLKSTVTQAAKDRTVTNLYPGNLQATVTQESIHRTMAGTVEVVQDTAADLKATVTQAAKDRTVTGQVDIGDVSKGTQTNDVKVTMDSEQVVTKKGDTNYTKVKKTGFYTTQQSDTTLWTPAAGKKFVITDIIVSVDTAMRVYLQDDATKTWEWHFAANGGCVINLQTPDDSAAADNVLSITMDAAGICSIKVLGYEE